MDLLIKSTPISWFSLNLRQLLEVLHLKLVSLTLWGIYMYLVHKNAQKSAKNVKPSVRIAVTRKNYGFLCACWLC